MDTKIEELLAGLTEPQRRAVTHTNGPLLILAGPGSGKTRVVTRRAAHLALTTTRAENILAITFTNKAAREMKSRIEELRVDGAMWVGTFHAFCARMLRTYAERVDLGSNFTILDRDDRRKVIKQAIEACNLSPTNFPAAAVERVISNAKNDMLSAAEFETSYNDWRNKTIARIYSCYEDLRREQNAVDFDDLLMCTAKLLCDDQEVRGQLEDRFRYVLVDEYQDTNAAQYQIAQMLSREHGNLCVTGDPDQSIYGWRGANIHNILSFEKDHPGAQVVHLEQNYRSTKKILAAASALIAGNTERKLKAIWTENDGGGPVQICEMDTGEDEARWIAEDIARLTREGVARNEMAVFYRINSMSRALEEAFIREGIEYQIARGLEFYNRKEIKDVLAYLRVLVNPADEVALLRIVNTPPRGIGATSVKRIREMASRDGQRVYDLITSGADFTPIGRSAAKVASLGELLVGLKSVLEIPAPAALEQVISTTGLRAMVRQADDAEGTAQANLDELLSAAGAFQLDHPEATLVDWLEHAALISDVDGLDDGTGDGLGKVTLMTLHAAKGLEFDNVYIIGLEDGMLPMKRQEDDGDVEEERRLCFVGMTRARKRLTLTKVLYRAWRGTTQRTIQSIFLDELPREAIEWNRLADTHSAAPVSGNAPKLPDNIQQWVVGALVRHPDTGLGRIESLSRAGKLTYITVQFQEGPTRSWVLEYCDLELVDFAEVD